MRALGQLSWVASAAIGGWAIFHALREAPLPGRFTIVLAVVACALAVFRARTSFSRSIVAWTLADARTTKVCSAREVSGQMANTSMDRTGKSFPICPSCHERMSSVEQGLGGVWSCLYCEGTWLSANQLKALIAASSRAPGPNVPLQLSSDATQATAPLCCPACDQAKLAPVEFGSARAEYCNQCGAAFFKKGVVVEQAPEIFSTSEEAPVAATLLGLFGAAAVGADPALIVTALVPKPRA